EKSRRRILALQAANGSRRLDIESTLAPAHLSAEARGRMGMILGDPDGIRVLAPNASESAGSGFLRRLIARTVRVLSGPIQA
ncbi:MAG: hypothetical protein PHF00_13175, partial [Elusimicrobia bacterium]|nr:hypothetical protein [Elusimicrobiota bacterium]